MAGHVITIKAREVAPNIEVTFGETTLLLTPTLANGLGQYLIDAARVLVSKPSEDKAHDEILDLDRDRKVLDPWQDPNQSRAIGA